jgi:glycerol-3-phosphate dehydrogenase
MRRDLNRLQATEFDLVVIGGGITGAAVAHDAALRGLSVALVEAHDFGSATSAASSKIIHGGIRYLSQGRVDKVRESARERAAFLRIAPHLMRTIPIVFPASPDWRRGRAALAAGSAAYGLVTAGIDGVSDPSLRVPPSRACSRDEVIRLIPALAPRPDVTGARILHETHMYSAERMTLAFVKSAAARGAVVANYVAAEGFLRRGDRVTGIRVRDVIAGDRFDVRARVVANAAGPWVGRLNSDLTGPDPAARTGWAAKGVHIVTRGLTGEVGLALLTRHRSRSLVGESLRHVFLLPWRQHTLVGTTNTPDPGDPDRVAADERDVCQLLEDVNDGLPGVGLGSADVLHAYAGLYPLGERARANPAVYGVSGDFEVVRHERHGGPSGLITAVGRKFTTARRLGELVVDEALDALGARPRPSVTAHTPLAGGDIADLGRFRADAHERYDARLGPAIVDHLVSAYGREIDAVVAMGGPAGLSRLARNRESIEAEVTYAARTEMAVRLDDAVFRRTGLGTLGHPGAPALWSTARAMARELAWDEARVAAEVQRTEKLFFRGS